MKKSLRDRVENKIIFEEDVQAWLEDLTPAELSAVALRASGMSRAEIAKEVGISHQRVSQRIAQARTKYEGRTE